MCVRCAHCKRFFPNVPRSQESKRPSWASDANDESRRKRKPSSSDDRAPPPSIIYKLQAQCCWPAAMIVSAHAAYQKRLKSKDKLAMLPMQQLFVRPRCPRCPPSELSPQGPSSPSPYIRKRSKNAEQLPRIMTGSASLGYAAFK